MPRLGSYDILAGRSASASPSSTINGSLIGVREIEVGITVVDVGCMLVSSLTRAKVQTFTSFGSWEPKEPRSCKSQGRVLSPPSSRKLSRPATELFGYQKRLGATASTLSWSVLRLGNAGSGGEISELEGRDLNRD